MSNIESAARARFETLKQAVSEGIAVCFIVGGALREIKEKELFKLDGHEDFDSFCVAEWGWTRRYCNQLILDAKVINGLPPNLRKLITSHDGARQLAKIPESLRAGVLDIATDNGKKTATAAALKRATPPPRKLLAKKASSVPPRKQKPAIEPQRVKPGPKEKGLLDKTGIEIPKEILALWNLATTDVNETLVHIKVVKHRLASAEKSTSKVFIGTNFNSALAACVQLEADVEAVLPFAVCPSCNGVIADDNCSCKGKGFVGKFFWNNCVPEEVRKMRG